MLKLYARDYCPNGVEAIALLTSLNYNPEVFYVGETKSPKVALAPVKSLSTEEFSQDFPDVRTFPFAIIDGICLEGLPQIKEYVAIER